MNSVISGSSGFIGSHLVRELSARKHKVFLIKREELYNPVKLKKRLKEISPDYIFHLASYGNMAFQTEGKEIFKANIGATWNMLMCAKDIKYKRFFHFSTSPHILDCGSFYGSTKKASEALCQSFKNVTIIRPYTIYGENEADFRFIPTVIRCLLKDELLYLSEGSHDFVYIGDFVNKIMDIIDYNSSPIWEIGTGVSTTNFEIVKRLMDLSGKSVQMKFKNLRDWDSKDWACKQGNLTYSDLSKGLEKTYLYYKGKYDR